MYNPAKKVRNSIRTKNSEFWIREICLKTSLNLQNLKIRPTQIKNHKKIYPFLKPCWPKLAPPIWHKEKASGRRRFIRPNSSKSHLFVQILIRKRQRFRGMMKTSYCWHFLVNYMPGWGKIGLVGGQREEHICRNSFH